MAQKRAKKAKKKVSKKKSAAKSRAAGLTTRKATKSAAKKKGMKKTTKKSAKTSAKKTAKKAVRKTAKKIGVERTAKSANAARSKTKASAADTPKRAAVKKSSKTYELKTKETAVSVDGFLSTVDNPKRVEQARVAIDLLKRVTGEEPKMWGPSIVGFGKYSYVYDSGHSGEMCMVGFSPRKAQFVFYMLGHPPETDEIWSRLGKYKLGGSCLYVNKFEDVDLNVIEEIATRSIAYMKAKYPAMAA